MGLVAVGRSALYEKSRIAEPRVALEVGARASGKSWKEETQVPTVL